MPAIRRYTVEYLFGKWIIGNPYREHLSKNYEDKIFFFEPVNKFYDLLWVKKLAYNQLKIVLKAHPELISELIGGTSSSVGIEGKLAEYYAPKNILHHNSTELEGLA
jgi:hypothetical protein